MGLAMTGRDLPRRLYESPTLWPALTLGAAAATLAGAWSFQLIGGLQPCTLCLYQRWPYWIVIIIAAFTVVAARQIGPRGLAMFALICALVFSVGAGFAGFHTGVEQSWWKGLESCGGGNLNDSNLSLAELKVQLMATPVVRCGDVPWSLFGISLAGYNFLVSLVFTAASLWAAQAFWRKAA